MRGMGRGGSTSSLVVEDATEVVSVRENVRLVREVCAARVDEIDTWEAWHVSVYLAKITWPPFMGHTIFLGDCLCSKMFLHGNWVIGASFDSAIDSDVDLTSAAMIGIRAIVGHNHALYTLYTPHTRNDTASGHVVPRVDFMSSKSRELQERASDISQGGDSTGQVSLRTLQP